MTDKKSLDAGKRERHTVWGPGDGDHRGAAAGDGRCGAGFHAARSWNAGTGWIDVPSDADDAIRRREVTGAQEGPLPAEFRHRQPDGGPALPHAAKRSGAGEPG